MTIAERDKLDRRFKRCNKTVRWLYKHHLISKKIKVMLTDKVDDMWARSYN